MHLYYCALSEDLRVLYHLPELLRKNNAPSVILIMAMVSKSKGISCWRDQHIHRPHGCLRWLKICKMFHWLPVTSLQYCKYRVMNLRKEYKLSKNCSNCRETTADGVESVIITPATGNFMYFIVRQFDSVIDHNIEILL